MTGIPQTITNMDQNNTASAPSRVEAMQQRKRLTKADIVGGTASTRDHYVKAWDGYVTIRPLSEGEWQHIRALTMRGISQRGKVNSETGKEELDLDIDTKEQMQGAVEADRLTVAYGLSVGTEQWTPDDVSMLSPPGVVEEIAQEILNLSGIRTPKRRRARQDESEQEALEAEVDSFPEDGRGAGDHRASDDRL